MLLYYAYALRFYSVLILGRQSAVPNHPYTVQEMTLAEKRNETKIGSSQNWLGANRPRYFTKYSRGYTLGSEETRAVGFLIDPPEGFETRGGEGARMRITTIAADGSKTLTETVFV